MLWLRRSRSRMGSSSIGLLLTIKRSIDLSRSGAGPRSYSGMVFRVGGSFCDAGVSRPL